MAIRVLFVDDNENMLKVVKQYIEQLDPEFEIVAVDSAEKGLGELDSRYFSVIVSDYQMPFMDGLEFLEKVRENHSDIPFIIFTGRSREEIAIKALNLGAAYYVEKGGDPKSQYQELVHIIRSLVIMRETIERHQVVFDHALEGIFIVDRESRKGYAANRAFYEMTGYSPADLADLSVDKIHPTEDLAHVVDEFEFQAAGLKKVAEKIPVLRKDGSVLIANITSNAITIGGKTYVLGLFSDISSQLTVQEALAESEEHFRLIAENSSDVIFTLDLDLNRTYLSPSVSNLRGLSKEESLSQTWAEIITPESLERMIQTLGPHIQELRDGIIPEYPISIELEMFHSQKGTIWVETTASPIFDSHGKPRGIVGITRDISHRISTESALKQSEERYRRLYENISDGVVNLDPAGRVVFCNDRLLQMFGYERDEVIGTHFTNYLDSESIEGAKDVFMKSILEKRADPIGFEGIGKRKDGSRFYFHLNSTLVLEGEIVEGLQSHIRDISDRKRNEEAIMKEREELSKYAHSMAHDLRSNIQSIVGFAGLMKETEKMQYADDIIQIALQMESLLTRSVSLADAGMVIGSPTPVNLSRLIEEVAVANLPDSVSIRIDNLPEISCDREKTMQVIQNLLTNAVEHGNAQTIEITSRTDDAGVSILFKNDGSPIPESIHDMIFQQGFSTKDHGGLGLNIVRRIVEAHGWTISLEHSEQTIFCISIPMSQVRRST